jgi:outer membrane protein OmpA-like peptidoglycan-associated protein
MLKLLRLLFFAHILSWNVFSQTTIEISGKVFALSFSTQDTLFLKNASVYLEFVDSLRMRQITDGNGRYKFLVSGSTRRLRIYAKANSKTFCKQKKQYCFISDNLSFYLPSNLQNFKHDFKFKHVTDCDPALPDLTFNLNSAKMVGQHDSIMKLVTVMRDFPLMKIQIQGHADSQERKPTSLSRKRARHVYKELIANGIDKSRLSYKSLSDMKPIISSQIITRDLSTEDILALREKNARVTFKIVVFIIE